MPAKSKAQQRFMGMVHAVQKGELSPSKVSDKVKDVADNMSDSDAEDFASTKHKGKPEKVAKEVIQKVREVIKPIVEDWWAKASDDTKAKYVKKHGSPPNSASDMEKDMSKAADDANAKMDRDEKKAKFEKQAKGDFESAIENGEGQWADEMVKMNSDHLPKGVQKDAQEALYAIQDAEMGMGGDADWAKDYLKKNVLPHIKVGEQTPEENITKESIIKENSYAAMFQEMSKDMRSSHQVQALKDLCDEYDIGRVLYVFRTNQRDFKNQIKEKMKEMKLFNRAKKLKEGAKAQKAYNNIHRARNEFIERYSKLRKQLNTLKTESPNNEILRLEKQLYKFEMAFIEQSSKLLGSVSKIAKSNLTESIKMGNFTFESDLGLTYKRGKTIKVTHKKSGKELIIIDKPNVKREYEKIGFYAESVNEEVAKGKGVQKIFDIQKSGYGKLGGRMVDQLSAGLFTQLYDKAPDNIKEKMNKMNEKRLYIVIGKMWDKFGKNVSLR